jgi:hypothetical protein
MSINSTDRAMIRERVEGALRDHNPEQYDIDAIASDLLDAGHRNAGDAAPIAAAWMIGGQTFWEIVRSHALITPGIIVEKTKEGWKIRSFVDLSDDTASIITFRAKPKQVTLGDHVDIVDNNGTRTGYVYSALYRTGRVGLVGEPYVICEIALD